MSRKSFIARPLALVAVTFALTTLVCAYASAYLASLAAIPPLLLCVYKVLRNRKSKQYDPTQARAAIILCTIAIAVAWFTSYQSLIAPIKQLIDAAIDDGRGIFAIPVKISRAISLSITKVFPERIAPFMRAITIGDAYELHRNVEVYTPLGISGIAHVVSVSGMHVAFLVSMISFAVKHRKHRAFVTIPLMLMFMAVAGFSKPVTRAVIMQSFVIIAPLVRRRNDSVTSVFTALLILLLIDPNSITNLGMQLSFLSTIGIVTITPRISEVFSAVADGKPWHKSRAAKRIYRFFTASIASSIGALALSTPLLAYSFGYVSLYAPIANLLTLWATSFSFCGGLIAALVGIISVPVGAAAAIVASVPTDWIILVAKTISRVPFAAVYVSNPFLLAWFVYLYAIFVIFVFLRGTPRAALWPVCGSIITLCLALMFTSATPRGGLTVTAIDVGQGQSLVLSDGAATAVIDCGGSYMSSPAARTASFLQTSAAPPVELLILTHFHTDHAGNVPELMAREKIDTLVIPDPNLEPSLLANEIIAYAERSGIEIIVITEITRFTFGNSQLTIYPPYGDGGANEFGLTILAADNDWEVLITGDMRTSTELILLEEADLPDIELYIAGHHGSRYSSSQYLLEETMPEAVIISVGADNTYDHPSAETLDRFAEFGIDVYRTDILGNITFSAR